MAAADAVANFAVSNVATAPTPAASGTTVVVTTGHGVRFPAVPFNATVMPATGLPTPLTAEIVRVTFVSVDTLTIVRAQEGSTARTILAGDVVAATITKKTLDDRLSFDQFDGLILPVEIGTPTAPAIGARLSAVRVAERSWPQWRRPQGLPGFLSPHLAFNRVGVWLPGGAAANTSPGAFGLPVMLTFGTSTGRSFNTSSAHTRRKRIGYVSVATAAANSGFRMPPNVTVGVGSGGNVGGFLTTVRFSISDAAAVTGARMFVGMSSLNVNPTGAVAEPSTLTDHIGLGHGTADTNLRLYFGGTTAQTPINLGVNFPTNTLASDMYELILHAPAESTVVHYTVNRYGSATNSILFTASGSLPNATPGTTLPAATLALTSTYGWRTNNATALAVGLDLHSHYFETDGA